MRLAGRKSPALLMDSRSPPECPQFLRVALARHNVAPYTTIAIAAGSLQRNHRPVFHPMWPVRRRSSAILSKAGAL